MNVYLPYQCYDNFDIYVEYIRKISAILEDCTTSKLAVIGDFNAAVSTTFTCMLNHGYIPSNFMKTSILKNRNDDTSDKNNYWRITIVTAMSKLFELCLSRILDEYLWTSENQFGFKRIHATDLCIYTVKSVIKCYSYFSSPVFTCFLDASTAFDKFNHWTLDIVQEITIERCANCFGKNFMFLVSFTTIV